MARSRKNDFKIIEELEIPASITVECDTVTVDILMDYEIEQANRHMPYSTKIHDHAAFEILIVENGAFHVQFGEATLTVKSGEVLLIRPHILHRLVGYTGNMRRFGMRFSITASETDIADTMPPYLHYQTGNDERNMIYYLISNLRTSQHANLTRMGEYRIKSQFGIILSYAFEHIAGFSTDQPSEMPARINLYTKIENYFYLNYSQQITLNSLASYFSYSHTQMRRILDKCFGMTFTDKLRDVRLNAAKQLLIAGNAPIEKIAEECGYETRQGFEAMFLKYIGMSPTQFRRANLESETSQ